MVTDYDAPRRTEPDSTDRDSLEELASRRRNAQSPIVDDESEAADGFDVPGADLSGEELTVAVVPQQADEFICSVCFLVQHRTRLVLRPAAGPVCADCA